MTTRRKFALTVLTGFLTLALTIGTALAAELVGKIKSVNADKHEITVTSEGGDDVVVTVNDKTEWVSPKGKTMKKAPDFAKMKTGTTLEITHEKAVASKVVIKKGAPKKDAPK